MKKTIILLLIVLVLIVGCQQAAIQKALTEEFEYKIYTDEDFSIKYPDWPITDNDEGDAG